MTQANQSVTQAVVATQSTMNPRLSTERIALFAEDGTALVLDDVSATGATVILTGYSSGSAGDPADTDTVNDAFAKVSAQADRKDLADEVLLTGYTSAVADDLAAGDTVLEAFQKLEARIVALEA